MDRATTSMRATSSTSATSGWRRRGVRRVETGAEGTRAVEDRDLEGGRWERDERCVDRRMEARGERAPGGEEARREGGARRGDDARGERANATRVDERVRLTDGSYARTDGDERGVRRAQV